MNKQSFWSFENEEDVSEYSQPKHNSKNYIDIDFLNQYLYIYEEDVQKGIQVINYTDEEMDDITSKLKSFLNIHQETSLNLIRILFDFENNLIMTKLENGQEDRFYFLDLLKMKSTIIESLNFETISSDELTHEFEAMMLYNQFNASSEEEKIEQMRVMIIMREQMNKLLDISEHLRENNATLDDNLNLTLDVFKGYLQGKVSRKDAEKFLLDVFKDNN